MNSFAQWRRLVHTPKGTLLLIFLALLAAAGAGTGWATVLPHVAWTVGGAVLVDLAGARLSGRGWRWPSSALLSGLIVAFVLGVETAGPVAAAVGALASASKYLLAYRRGHVFNPAALALALAIPLFATGQSWWGALADMPAPWSVLLAIGGALIVDRVNKWPMALSFLASYFGLFLVAAMANPARVAEMFRAPFVQAALFLAFFMLTDPPTSPGRASDQAWMGGLAAAVAGIAQLAGAGQVYLLLAVLAVNVALMVKRWSQDRQRPGPARPLGITAPLDSSVRSTTASGATAAGAP
jgi:Na+-transporting NADH:ubiquinone oxidoreductase subunit NqrB